MQQDYFKMICGHLVLIYFFYLSECNRVTQATVLCENTSLNISCEESSIIEILDVRIGPYTNGQGKLVETITRNVASHVKTLCDNGTYCILNSTEYNLLEDMPYLERLVNVTYQCDYEYLSCNKDNTNHRLLSGDKLQGTKNMSALICRNFCHVKGWFYTYFGTEAADSCFCGYDNDILKLNRTLHPLYEAKHLNECNLRCAEHDYESCGGTKLISLYTTKTELRRRSNLKSFEISTLSCNFNATVKNVTLVGHYISKYCEVGKIKTSGLDCSSGGICFVRQSFPKEQFKLDDVHSKFIKLKYTCKASYNGKDEQWTEKDSNGESTAYNNMTGENIGNFELHGKYGIPIGITIVVCLIGGIIAVIYTRNRRKRVKSVEDNNMSPDVDHAVTEYLHVQGNNYFRPVDVVVYEQDTPTSLIGVQSNTNDRQTDMRLSFSEDAYADAVEGVYDKANKPRYNEKHHKEQCIYSHSMDDVYDTTNKRRLKTDEVENLYD